MKKILFSISFMLVLLVVLATTASAQSTDNGDGTITDSNTGLIWQKDQSSIKNWAGIISYCDSLALGGSSDWRAPTKTEIEGIFTQNARSCGPSAGGDYSTAYLDSAFDCHESVIWSGSECSASDSLFVNFAEKSSGCGSKTGGVFAVRCVLSRDISQVCTDTDNGRNIYVKGRTIISPSDIEDGCTNRISAPIELASEGFYVVERYCAVEDGITKLGTDTIQCPSGLRCSNGACVEPTEIIGCTDSDGGKNYNIKGYINMPNHPNPLFDGCINNIKLAEATCDIGNGDYGLVYYDCPNGCKDGACIKSTSTCTLTEKDCPMICADCAMGYAGGGCNGGIDYNTCTCKKPAPCIQQNKTVKETVTCIFEDGEGEQECYSEKGSCKAFLGTKCKEGEKCLPREPPVCTVEVSGKKGDKITWKSSCGGYAYTTIEGVDENAKFRCKDIAVCTEQYDPVCGTDGRTYSNSCFAKQAGAGIAYYGECKERSVLSISSVWSDKKAYNAGERIVVYAKIVDADGTPATPEEGAAVGFGLQFSDMTAQQPTAVSETVKPIPVQPTVEKTTAIQKTTATAAGNVNVIQATTAVPAVAATSIAARYFKVSEARYNPETGYYEGTSIAPYSSGTLQVIVTASKGSVSIRNADLYLKIVRSTKRPVEEPVEIEVPTIQKSEPQEAVSEQALPIEGETISVPVLTCVNGCAADSRCLPFGTRLAQEGKPYYCDISQSFDAQKAENEACQNNYECFSNQCSNGHCVDLEKQLKETRSMLADVMEWLRSIFGSKKVNGG